MIIMLLHDHVLRGDRPAAICIAAVAESKDKKERMIALCMRAGKEKGAQRTILPFDKGARQLCQRHGTQGLKELLELVAIP